MVYPFWRLTEVDMENSCVKLWFKGSKIESQATKIKFTYLTMMKRTW